TEWSEVFIVRDLARRAPEGLTALEAGPHPSLYDLGALIAITTFSVGWLALAGSTLRTGIPSRPAGGLVIAGFFAIPLFGALLAAPWGAILGNIILGSGWFWLGFRLRGARPA